jgi:hypothetical protein
MRFGDRVIWDSFVKNVGVLTAVATLVGSAIAFFAQRADDLEQRALQALAAERESKKVFLEKQAVLFFETVPLVSRLAIAETPDEIDDKDERRFWELFWGELGMVEDVNVARSMDLFGRSLQAFRGATSNEVCAARRKSISLTLSHCVRKSLGENWGVDFGADNLDWCTDERLRELDQGCSTMIEKVSPNPKQPKSRAN